MKHIFFLAAILSLFSVTSCKKDKDDDPPPAAGKRLKKMTEVEGSVTHVYNFSYDANNRFSSMKTTDNARQILLTYDANGNVTKLEEFNEDYHNIQTYTYNNSVPATSTFKSWEPDGAGGETLWEHDELTYTVANGKVTAIQLAGQLPGDITMNFTVSYDANGQLSQVHMPNFYTANFTYGTKKSPFPKVFKYVMDHGTFSTFFFPTNDLLSMSYDFPGTIGDQNHTFQHTYGADGYPTTTTGGGVTRTYEYE